MYEVIVVNNNSSDDTLSVAASFAKQSPGCRVVTEQRQGLSHARNRGFQEALGRWVVYLDDDAKALEDCIDKILRFLRQYDFDGFGGVYKPWYREGKPKWFQDRYASNANLQEHAGPLPEGKYASGGIFVVRKDVLQRQGGFPTQLGMNRAKVSYGEETYFQIEMRQAGYRIGFAPDVKIRHLVPHHKHRLTWFFRAALARGRDFWNSHKREPSALIMASIGITAFILLLKALAARTPQLGSANYYVQNWIIDVFSPLIWDFGRIVGGIKWLIQKEYHAS
jgi:GT2 family glycosyltransferase